MPRILIIDDDDQILTSLREVLEWDLHEVVDAPNGEVGMKLFREEAADLVITDILMPDKEGTETIRELRRDFPEVKIMAISGGGRGNPDAYLSLAKALGAEVTLTKPFGRAELLAAVRGLLE